MIVTRPKEGSAILASLAPHRRVALVGCGLCATSCRTGGAPEVEAMASLLASRGWEIAWREVIDGVCQKLLTARTVGRLPAPDAVLALCCGSGVQTLAGVLEVPVHPALDTIYLGGSIRLGRFEEKCSLCGACIVDRFAGLCPVTLCPKGTLNGPCGGMQEGKCEVGGDRECVWYRIFLRQEASGNLASMEDILPPRSRLRGSWAPDGA